MAVYVLHDINLKYKLTTDRLHGKGDKSIVGFGSFDVFLSENGKSSRQR